LEGLSELPLVSCPIALYPAASRSERVSFNRINKKTGHRLKKQLADAATGGLGGHDPCRHGQPLASQNQPLSEFSNGL
jgi:non-homologous end joining protein Ku